MPWHLMAWPLMTVRPLALALLLSTAADPLWADALDEALRATWRDQWVVLLSETYADCMDCVTVNDLGPEGVTSDGVRRFERGELGRVVDLEVKKERIEVHVDLAEPVLVSSPRAGVLLYRERGCAIQLRIAVPREAVKARDAAALDERLAAALERFATVAEARAFPLWNGRVRQSPPDGYESTLDAYRALRGGWAERATAAATTVAREVIRRHPTLSYLEGFAEGTPALDPDPLVRPSGLTIEYQDQRNWSFSIEETDDPPGWGDCEDLVDLPPPEVPASSSDFGSSDFEEQILGRSDGRALAYALELIARIQECEKGDPEASEP